MVAWEGPSRFTGEPLIVVVTGLKRPSTNRKTGPLLQSYILSRDKPPHVSVYEGTDQDVCGACPLSQGDGCYVIPKNDPRAVWEGYHRGLYPALSPREVTREIEGRPLRMGAYGEPTATPLPMWLDWARASKMWVGYTHTWRAQEKNGFRTPACDWRWRWILMASVHGDREAREARDRGWRYFKTGSVVPWAREFECPATRATNPLTCLECRACGGTRFDRLRDRGSVTTLPHGVKANRVPVH